MATSTDLCESDFLIPGFVGSGTMGQFSFFDTDKRLAAISAKGDPLAMIDRVVPFESFRAEIEAVVLTPADEKKSNAGRKPIDVLVMFRMLVLQSLYNPAEIKRLGNRLPSAGDRARGAQNLLRVRTAITVRRKNGTSIDQVPHHLKGTTRWAACLFGGARPAP
jgi:hypothetical protein